MPQGYSLFFNKVAGLRPKAQVFSCEFCEISNNTFLKNTSGRLLLYLHKKVISEIFDMVLNTEAVAQMGFVKKVVLPILENSQEKTCSRAS